jgi:hypothetical protein
VKQCHWTKLDEDGDGDDGSYFAEFYEEWCCGEPAMWKRWGKWFCAKHYDALCELYGEPETDEDL